MSNPVCISPLKFYDSPAKQNHRKSYAHGHISPLLTKRGWIPPFQFVIPNFLYNAGGDVNEVKLFDGKTDELVCIISSAYTNQNFIISVVDNYRVLKYLGQNKIPGELQQSSSITVNSTSGQMLQSAGASAGDIFDASSYSYADAVWVSDLIPISPSSFYNIIASSWYGYGLYAIYDANQNYITGEFANQGGTRTVINKQILTPSNAAYIRIASYYVKNAALNQLVAKDLLEGYYYIKVSSANDVWAYYSEIFCFTEVTQDLIEIEYWNETGNFAVKNGVIAFPDNFHFKLLLKTEIGKPEYNFEEESTKRLGYIFVESQVSKKTYKFNTVVPEYICDALRLVRLCDNKIIRCKDDEYEAITFEMEAEWQTQGDLASVTCEFETDNIIANIGGFVPDKLGGDYNNDYNEDFDKE